MEISTASVSTRSSKSRNDSGYSSPTHTDHHECQVDPKQLKAILMNVEQSDGTKFTSKFNQENQKLLLKPVNQNGMSEQTKEHLLAAGLLKDNSAEIKINDSGYSSPTYTSQYSVQVNPEQLEKRLEIIEPKKEDKLLEKIE